MKYTGPRCRLCRREGKKLFLKGDKCFSQKCPVTKRNYPPGQHTKSFGKPTEYAIQLREKQKAKRIYGINETQFSNYYSRAVKKKGAVTGDLMFQLLESRLDNVLYRVGIADSRNQARQFISHGLFRVNNRTVTIPSIQMKAGDAFEVSEKFKNNINFTKKKDKKAENSGWLEFDFKNGTGTIKREIAKEDLPNEVDVQLIVEYYSR